MSPKIELSVVIPAYNEADNFSSGILQEPINYLKSQKYAWEIIFVDDGSTDKTYSLLKGLSQKHPQIKVLQIPHGGKASAVTAGMLTAQGSYILFTDFDQSTPLHQVEKFLATHKKGIDVVIGVRGGDSSTKQDTLIRKIRSWMFVKLVQVVALPGIKDSQCGFKSFSKQAAQQVFSSLQVSLPKGVVTGGYMGAFDVEVLFLARKYKYQISQIPVDWIKYPSNRLNIWREPLLMAIDTFKVRLWDILNKYDQTS